MLTDDGYNNIKNIWRIIKQLLLSIEVLSMVFKLILFTNLMIVVLAHSVITINQQAKYRVITYVGYFSV